MIQSEQYLKKTYKNKTLYQLFHWPYAKQVEYSKSELKSPMI